MLVYGTPVALADIWLWNIGYVTFDDKQCVLHQKIRISNTN